MWMGFVPHIVLLFCKTVGSSTGLPSIKKNTNNAKESIVSAKVKMNMIHEAFFTIFALLVAMVDIGIFFMHGKRKTLQ